MRAIKLIKFRLPINPRTPSVHLNEHQNALTFRAVVLYDSLFFCLVVQRKSLFTSISSQALLNFHINAVPTLLFVQHAEDYQNN